MTYKLILAAVFAVPTAVCAVTCPDEAQWIWLPGDAATNDNTYARFTTVLPAGADSVRIAVSGNYSASVDGETVAFGQYTDFPRTRTYTETPIPPAGRNRELAVTAWFSGNRFSSHYDGVPGLWAEILEDGRVVKTSSRAWSAAPVAGFAAGPRSVLFLSHNYTWEFDARKPAAVPQAAVEVTGSVLPARPRPRPVEPAKVIRTVCGTEVGRGPGFAVFDFGEEVTGLLAFRVDARAGTRIEILHGEGLRDGRLPDFASADGDRRMVDTYVAKEGVQRYEHLLRRYGLRYLEFRWDVGEVRAVVPEIAVTELTGLETPAFDCSDRRFVRFHEVSCRTLRCCLHEKYENCPWREQSICECDARNQMLFGYPLWGNYGRAAAMLRLFGEAERDHGFLPAITPSASGTVIPAFTFQWMVAVCEHAWYSGDDTVLRDELPRIRRMLGKVLACRKDGLFAPPDSLPGATWVWNYCEPRLMEWRGNAPNAFYNLYLREALAALASSSRRIGETACVAQWEDASAEIASRCERYWDEGRGAYADALTPDGTREGFFGHVQALFLAAGLVPSGRVERVIGAVRTGAVPMPELPALPHLVKGVFAHGTDADRSWLHGKIGETYGAMLEKGATTWWETTEGAAYSDGGGSLCHGWSAMPAWYEAEYILGVRPTSPGYATYEIRPRVPGVTGSGRVMTPRGPIAVSRP